MVGRGKSPDLVRKPLGIAIVKGESRHSAHPPKNIGDDQPTEAQAHTVFDRSLATSVIVSKSTVGARPAVAKAYTVFAIS